LFFVFFWKGLTLQEDERESILCRNIVLLLWQNNTLVLFSRYSRDVSEQVACQWKLQNGYLNGQPHSFCGPGKVRQIWKYNDAIHGEVSGIFYLSAGVTNRHHLWQKTQQLPLVQAYYLMAPAIEGALAAEIVFS
jgi:hypothetical protein